MNVRKYRWSKDYESAEEELHALLNARSITAERYVAHEDEVIAGHVHEVATTLWCAEGMFSVSVTGKAYSMQPGDALDIPAGTAYDLTARFGGCVWYQSQ